jgi:hypothetical protein
MGALHATVRQHLTVENTDELGTARRKGGSGNRGRPVEGEGSGLNVAKAAAMAGVGRGKCWLRKGP